MNMRMKNYLRRFRKEEKGSVFLIEFMVMAPMLFFMFFFGFELSMHSIRQMQLDRGLEVTTREVRLNTAVDFTHDVLKQTICANAGGLENCNDNLRLEMVTRNARGFTPMPEHADCINSSEEVTPVRGWSLGKEHELMMMRACYRFVPMWGKFGLGAELDANGDGYAEMVSVSAFVQEPR